MDSYHFELDIDPTTQCNDCGKEMELFGKWQLLCDNCNKRYQREAEIDKEVETGLLDEPFSDELDYWGV